MRVDVEILALLGAGDVEEGERRYAQLFHAFRRFFEWRGCADPEALAQTVFERGLERLRDGAEIGESGISGYLHGFAKLLLLESRRERRTVPIDVGAAAMEPISRAGDAEKALLIKQLMAKLTPEERRTLIRYVNGNRAGEPGETASALRIRVFRIRKKLLGFW